MRAAGVRGAAALLTLLVLTSCANPETSETLFPDAPSTIEVGGREDDASMLELVHESGLTHRVEVRDGLIHPPLLIDGAWTLSSGERNVSILRVGLGVDSNDGDGTDELGERLLSCWRDEANGDFPDAPDPRGVRCTQSLVTHIAVQRGYADAAGVIRTAHELLGNTSNLWGWYCGIAGDAAALGAVLGGADAKALIDMETSFCDYSVIHGAGAATALLNPDDVPGAIDELCAHSSTPDASQIFRASQCWHGAGNGIARLTRLDPSAGARICADAPDESARTNCIDGIYSFLRTYRLRGDGALRSWPVLEGGPSSCAAIGEDENLLEACYRSSAQILVRDAALQGPTSSATRSELVDRMLVACERLPAPRRGACWSGLGTLIAFTLHPDIRDRDEVERRAGLCSQAPDQDSAIRCYDRVAIGIVKNGQLVNGLPIEEVVDLLPPGVREVVQPGLENWVRSLGGRSS